MIHNSLSERWSPRDLAVGIVLAVLAMWNGFAYRSLIPVGFFLDDAAYVLGAKSLLHGAYQALYLPGHPPQLDYHPGLPLLLAFFVPWVNGQWSELLAVNAVLLGTAAFLLWRLSRSWISAGSGAVIAGLFLIHDSTARLSGQLFPEPLFACLLLLLFSLWRRQLEKPLRAGWILMGLVAGWAALTRPEGSLVLVAVAAGLLYHRRWRALIGAIGIPALIYGAWVARNMHSPEPPDFMVFLQNLTYLAQHPGVYFRNIDLVLRIQLAAGLLGFYAWPPFIAGRIGGYGLMLAAALAMVGGIWGLARKGENEQEIIVAIAVFLLCRFLLLTLRTALDLRYMVVGLPFLLLLGAAGLEQVFRKRFPAVLVGIGLVLTTAYGYARNTEWRHLVQEHQAGRTALPMETLRWISEHTQLEDRILGPAPLFNLYTGRTGFTALYAPDADTFYSYMLRFGVRYIWTGPADVMRTMGSARMDHVQILYNTTVWTAQNPRRYRLLYQNDLEQTRLYSVQPASKI